MTVDERISFMEGQVVDLRDMMKKMLKIKNQTAASVAKGGEGKTTNLEICQEEDEVEIMEGGRRRPHLEPIQREERGGGYGERQEGYYGRRGANFEDIMGDFEGVWAMEEQGKTGKHGVHLALGREETMKELEEIGTT
ncbi:hypothetical protein KFK09_017336 [Dendrobium nobile]|uniref:Uncharacterized protein n=1 Tax=Dendrobium nobile TaxID=94219 RepID=A0A8T3B1X0_DENNO|nr:hypothetical protein KFK09_017336 [Dendrobium nobile]